MIMIFNVKITLIRDNLLTNWDNSGIIALKKEGDKCENRKYRNRYRWGFN